MEDFFFAGGINGVMKELLPLLHRDALTVTGKSVAANVKDAKCHDRRIIRPLDDPLHAEGGMVVLRGNLCPSGAVLKQTAADPKLLKHRGRGVVFESIADIDRRIDDPRLKIDETCVLVMKGGGPKGAPGMPERGHLPIPRKLLKRGVSDMVRISDSRMSGTAFGTVVLHISPESAIGGPLAVVQDGDTIELDTPNRKLSLLIIDRELKRRLIAWKPDRPHYDRGYGKLFLDHVMQAEDGVDFDFLRATDGVPSGS